MTENTTDDNDIGPTIREVVRTAESIDRDSCVALVAIECDTFQQPVRHRLDELERQGEVFLVPTAEGKEVRLP